MLIQRSHHFVGKRKRLLFTAAGIVPGQSVEWPGKAFDGVTTGGDFLK
jgi:hypothetical protein